MPTATASDAARSSWTSRRDSSPESQRRPGDGDVSVERDRDLVRDERTPERLPRTPRLVLPARLVAVEQLDVDAGSAQLLEPTRCNRIRIERADDDARDARVDHSVDARWRAAMMRARLERHVQRRAARTFTRLRERAHLRVVDRRRTRTSLRRRPRRRRRRPRRRADDPRPFPDRALRARAPARSASRERLDQPSVRALQVFTVEDRGSRRRSALRPRRTRSARCRCRRRHRPEVEHRLGRSVARVRDALERVVHERPAPSSRGGCSCRARCPHRPRP